MWFLSQLCIILNDYAIYQYQKITIYIIFALHFIGYLRILIDCVLSIHPWIPNFISFHFPQFVSDFSYIISSLSIQFDLISFHLFFVTAFMSNKMYSKEIFYFIKTHRSPNMVQCIFISFKRLWIIKTIEKKKSPKTENQLWKMIPFVIVGKPLCNHNTRSLFNLVVFPLIIHVNEAWLAVIFS